MQSESFVPPVVAVVVAADPGPWFEECLAALGGQDYPNLSVLVVDAAGGEDPTERVAAALPAAYVRRMGRRAAFGTAANEVVGVVDGASHYLLCHDDVAPDPGAVRLMVEEAFRTNAGIVTPKLVEWTDSRRLLAVGASTDRVGVVHPLVERGELDQQQHDTPRDVFMAPGGAVLVRADLFDALGGFDRDIADCGEDLDLSWRARVAGARIVVAPTARVRHLQATAAGLRAAGSGRSGSRRSASPRPDLRPGGTGEVHRLRTLLTCSSAVTLTWLAPVALAFIAGEALMAALAGRVGDACRVLAVPVRAARDPRHLLAARRRVQRQRNVADRALHRLQTAGSARLRAWFRSRFDQSATNLPVEAATGLDDEGWLGPAPVAESRGRRDHPEARRRRGLRLVSEADPAAATPAGAAATPAGAAATPAGAWTAGAWTAGDPAVMSGRATAPPGPPGAGADPQPGAARLAAVWPGPPRPASWRLPLTAAMVILVVLAVGSRELLVHGLPSIGTIPNTAGGPLAWWRAWLSTWQPAGMGSVGPSAPALGLLSIAGFVLFGAVGTLQHVLVLGPLVVGPLGAYRMARPWGARRGPVVSMIAYAAAPLPYDAVARGSWEGLIAYAAAPWVLAALGRLSDSLPHPSTATRHLAGRVLGLGLLTALVGAVSPSWLAVLAVTAAALAVGSLLVGQVPVAARLLLIGVAAGAVGFVLLLPWSARVASSSSTFFGVAAPAGAGQSFASLLRLDTGPFGSGPLAWGLVAAAALPLVVGRSWRLAWAARLWIVVLVDTAWAWEGTHGALPAPPPDVLLAVVAAALAGSVALGAVAFEQDLPGYRFGWRQAATAVAVVGLVLTALPVVAGTANGRWRLPQTGPATALTTLNGVPGGDYRMLWIGAPSAIPLASAPLGHGLAWATSFDGTPGVADSFPVGAVGGASAVVAALQLTSAGRTSDLGHLLAPLGVRYLVVPDAGAGRGGRAEIGAERALLSGLSAQTDLQPVTDTVGGYTVYQDAAWLPVRASLGRSGADLARGRGAPGSLAEANLGAPRSALHGATATRARGDVAPGGSVYVAATDDRRWRLRVGGPGPAGRVLHPSPAFGTGMLFRVPPDVGGPAVLSVGTAGGVRAEELVEVLVWLLVVGLVLADRRRRGRAAEAAETVRPEWFAPLPPRPARRPARHPERRPEVAPAEDLKAGVDG